MFHDYQQKISETRTAIRRYIHQKHIYDNFVNVLKDERSIFRKAETRLKKYGLGATLNRRISLHQIFVNILEESNQMKSKSRRDMLLTKLNQMAGSRVIEYLTERVFMQAPPSCNVRSLEREEAKLKKSMEKYLEQHESSQANALISFTFKVENLKEDLHETNSALELGKKAREELVVLQRVLRDMPDWGIMETDGGEDSNAAFNHAVQIHILLCALKNELREFYEGRDLALHLEAITDFKNTFFNNLIADWIEEQKIKLSVFYVRKTQNSLEALLQGLKTKTIRIENELSITSQEQNAIIGKICQH